MPQFFTPLPVFASATLLRLTLLLYGLHQDAHSPLKYTDIDYYVFTDAARSVSHGHSPYERETYRYTPLLAWLLLPTTWSSTWWFSFGKVLFAVGDLVAGWLIVLVLRRESDVGGNGEAKGKGEGKGRMSMQRALKFASIWLLNPMVATISTRGSSEGLLGVIVVALVWAVMGRRIVVAGFLLGFGVHFKIYPFIYAVSIVWWLDDENLGRRVPVKGIKKEERDLITVLRDFINGPRVVLGVTSLATFGGLNALMYYM